MQRFSAPFFASALVLIAACPADSGKTTGDPSTTSEPSTGGSTTDPSGTTTNTPTTDEPTTNTPTTVEPTTGNPTTATTTNDPTTATTTDPTTATTTSDDTTTDDSTTDQTTGGGGVCGDGNKEGGEACDDNNLKTEISPTTKAPLIYTADDCIDDCSLILALCGNGKMDPGEACDDGNQDSYDACTTSCTLNDKNYHAPCKRMCQNMCDTDVSSGTFTGCDNMEVPAAAKGVCYVSTKFALAPRYFAEGECAATAQVCTGGILCPPNIGKYDDLKDCPAGTTLIDRTTMAAGITVKTKVCQKVCDSDADCRWNAFDSVWGKSGQYRCQTTADSKGVKICADEQN